VKKSDGTATSIWLSNLQKKWKLSRTALAEFAQVSKSTVDAAITGDQKIGIEMLELIANAFNVTLPKRVQGEAGQRKMKHGLTRINGKQNPLYTAFMNMHDRCTNPRSKDYKHYGGATPPVSVCPQWAKTPEGLEAFCKHLGEKPAPGYSIHRIDPLLNYEPGNVKWATPREQNILKRKIVPIWIGNELTTVNQATDRLHESGAVESFYFDCDGKRHHRRRPRH
jgi:transcriptional regulator with XRE-family HTH domain